MSAKSVPSRRTDAGVHRPLPRLPHPSWGRRAAVPELLGARQGVSAEDFWNRLGL